MGDEQVMVIDGGAAPRGRPVIFVERGASGCVSINTCYWCVELRGVVILTS
jgi:hypothetical protein